MIVVYESDRQNIISSITVVIGEYQYAFSATYTVCVLPVMEHKCRCLTVEMVCLISQDSTK